MIATNSIAMHRLLNEFRLNLSGEKYECVYSILCMILVNIITRANCNHVETE